MTTEFNMSALIFQALELGKKNADFDQDKVKSRLDELISLNEKDFWASVHSRAFMLEANSYLANKNDEFYYGQASSLASHLFSKRGFLNQEFWTKEKINFIKCFFLSKEETISNIKPDDPKFHLENFFLFNNFEAIKQSLIKNEIPLNSLILMTECQAISNDEDLFDVELLFNKILEKTINADLNKKQFDELSFRIIRNQQFISEENWDLITSKLPKLLRPNVETLIRACERKPTISSIGHVVNHTFNSYSDEEKVEFVNGFSKAYNLILTISKSKKESSFSKNLNIKPPSIFDKEALLKYGHMSTLFICFVFLSRQKTHSELKPNDVFKGLTKYVINLPDNEFKELAEPHTRLLQDYLESASSIDKRLFDRLSRLYPEQAYNALKYLSKNESIFPIPNAVKKINQVTLKKQTSIIEHFVVKLGLDPEIHPANPSGQEAFTIFDKVYYNAEAQKIKSKIMDKYLEESWSEDSKDTSKAPPKPTRHRF